MRRSILIGSLVVALVVVAAVFGPGALTASGAEPAACGSCHIMEKNVSSFHATTSEHGKQQLSCGDCHNPDTLLEKYKTSFRHIKVNMSDEKPEELRLNADARKVVTANCVRCHANEEHSQKNGKSSCLNCHSNDPHGERGK